MRIKYFGLILFSSLILFLMVMPLRSAFWGGFKTSSLVGFTACFFLTFLCFKKFNGKLDIKYVILALILGHWIFELPLRIMDFSATLGSLPDSIIHTLGIICGFLYFQLKNPVKTMTAALGISATVFMYFQGWDYWAHFLNYGTFTGRVQAYSLPTKFESFNETQNFITEKDFNNKIVLLDFWTTTCGVCFQKFPKLQDAYSKQKDNPSVVILAVNTPLEEDEPNQAFEMIKKREYSFPVVITKDADLAEKWGVKGYPTTFVINPNGQIVYKGDLEGAIRIVDELKESK